MAARLPVARAQRHAASTFGPIEPAVKQLNGLATVGFKPVALMLGETAFLAALALLLMRWLT